jgi:predicted secreted protein
MRYDCRMRSALALLIALAPAAALAGDKAELQVVGFSEDASAFAYLTYGIEDGSGFSYAELVVLSTRSGKKLAPPSAERRQEEGSALDALKAQVAPKLADLKLGQDPGVELYRSGTATKTSFTVAGKTYTLTLLRTVGDVGEGGDRKDRFALKLEGGGKRRVLATGGGGFDYALNSVRLSADGKAAAVFLRHSTRGFEGPNRRYTAVAFRF